MDAETIAFIKEAGIIGAAASVVIAFFSWVSAYFRDLFGRRKRARYLGIKVIPILDNFIVECATSLQDNGTYMGESRPDGSTPPTEKLPSPPDYGDDIDWLSINYRMMYDLQLLGQETRAANEQISFVDKHISSGPYFHECFDARADHLPDLALKARRISKSLAKKYKVPDRYSLDWWAIDIVEKKKQESVERERELKKQRSARKGSN